MRSALGFEVQVRQNQLEYREQGHVLSLQPHRTSQAAQIFNLRIAHDAHWNAPFETELISEKKKKEIIRAVIAAVAFLQAREMRRER